MEASEPPRFLVWAIRDPTTDPLDRVQVIKGWTEQGAHHEDVYDVACSSGATVDGDSHRCSDNGAAVDLVTCSTQEGQGASELEALWEDPQLRSEPARLLLRPRPAEPHLSLVDLGRDPGGSSAEARPAGHDPGAGLVLADLVRAWRGRRGLTE